MKVQKKVSVQGDWADKGKDIKDQDIVKILDAGEIIDGDYGERQIHKIKTRNGEKNLSLNQTTINNLIDAFGDETKKWINKEVKVWILRQNIQGKMKQVVYLTAPDWEMNEDGFQAPNTGEDGIPIIEEEEGGITEDDVPDDMK